MTCEATSDELKVSITTGLGDRTLEHVFSVEVAQERRNVEGWPEVMVAGVIMPEGDPAVWACDRFGGAISAVTQAAREYSEWGDIAAPGSDVTEAKNMWVDYPETAEAIACIGSS